MFTKHSTVLINILKVGLLMLGLFCNFKALINHAHALPKIDPTSVVFTDPLYEEWKDTWQSGTTALYDLNAKKGEVKDVCGKVADWSVGHAYDGHQGWDRNIPNDNGIYPVFSIGPGVVEKMADDCVKGDKGCHGGAGNYVFIRHNKSVVSKFFHLVQGKVFVKSSQWVDRFYPIGLGGSTGNSDGEHVHVQIEIDGVAVDPISLAAQWSPPLVVDENSCNIDPQHNLIQYQSLDQFVAEKFKAFSTTLSSSGYTLSKKKYWLLDSHGVDNKDIIIEEYIKGGDKSALVYDLVGHGSQAIFMPHAVLKWWFEQGSVYGYGKPLASAALASGPNIYTTEFYFEKGSVKTTSSSPDDPNPPLTASAYPDSVAPGMFVDGWYAGKSYAFMNSYVKNGGSKKVGYPTTQNSTTPFVHNWSGYSVQVFSGGSLGSCGIMLQKTNDNFQAFLIPGKIWMTYHAPTQGPDIFGAPINDVYFDTQFAMNRQDFEKGMSILESGEVITSSNQCPDIDITSTGLSCKCPGSTKQSSCGKCGFQKWSCINYMWTQTNTCTSEGSCTPGEQESQICGKCSNGVKIRTCMSNCIWNTWSSCVDPDSQKICCEASMNDCGGCKTLTAKLYSSCGTNGTYECDGKDSVICKEVPISNPPPNTPDVVSSPDTTNYSDTKSSPDAGSTLDVISSPPDTQATQPDAYSPPDTYTPPPNSPPDTYTPPPDVYTPPPNYNVCGGTSALQATPGTSCGNCGGTWQCSGANSVTCANAKVYTYDSQKVCGPKYCLQITGVSGSYATAKLSKMSGSAFGNMPLEWMISSSNPTKVLATPNAPFCTSLYNGQAEISANINLATMSGQMQVQAKFWSDLKCGAYEITPQVIIQKCN